MSATISSTWEDRRQARNGKNDTYMAFGEFKGEATPPAGRMHVSRAGGPLGREVEGALVTPALDQATDMLGVGESGASRLHAELPTGELTLTVQDGPPVADLCDVAARANPKRGFLIVSKVLGRHLPARPSDMRAVMAALARKIPADAAEPMVFLGMAETATALGQGVFEEHRRLHPLSRTIYLQSSRQRVRDAVVFASFEEGHSHATTHLVQIRDGKLAQKVSKARTLVLVDDECSTGRTFVAAAEALASRMPELAGIHTCCITDWTGDEGAPSMPVAASDHSVLRGRLEWRSTGGSKAPEMAASSNHSGFAPDLGMSSRAGIRHPERASRRVPASVAGERVLVLGDGEHSYEALLVAEELEAAGCIAAVQCITRSPALVGHAMRTASRFDDAYGSGAPCFLYNILAHRPDRILVVAEVDGPQVADAAAALAHLGAVVPVHMVHCTYPVADRDHAA